MKLRDNTVYEEQLFEELELRQASIKSSFFELCKFVDCDFSESEFVGCKFTDCEFKSSNLKLAKFSGSRLRDVLFKHCVIVGVNWTSLQWPSVALSAPLVFESCDVSYSVFNSLQLPEMVMRSCKAHDVDFSECDLTGADFFETDLLDSRFNQSRLNECDFRGALNYSINPLENSIKGASFSMPDVLSLLSPFNIKVDADD